jgi:hypothetical protein
MKHLHLSLRPGVPDSPSRIVTWRSTFYVGIKTAKDNIRGKGPRARLDETVLHRICPASSATKHVIALNAGLIHPQGRTFTVAEGQPISNDGSMAIKDYLHAPLNRIRGAGSEMTTKGTVLSSHFEFLLDKVP